MMKRSDKRGQAALFIIIGIVLVGSIAAYFLLRGGVIFGGIPVRFQPLHQYVLDCSKESAELGVGLLEKQGGYIYLPEFSRGSEFAPVSSQLDFFGAPVPYWYYVSGNGIVKEQVPSQRHMEEQLEQFIEEDLARCSLANFVDQGFLIDRGEPEVDVSIDDEEIGVSVRLPLSASFGDEKVLLEEFRFSSPTKLGKFYEIALDIYSHEKNTAFLEQYGVDVLRLYAPVDNVEISCAPKVWNFQNVREEIQNALEANVQAIRVQGDYYELKDKRREYFVVEEVESDEQVNFLYSKFWPTKIEVNPAERGILLAEPVGSSAGLGALGFCYVPYHFVYDLQYPVLIQVLDEKEVFQFPVAVIIDKNKPREGLEGEAVSDVEPALCQGGVQEMEIFTYDTKLEPVKADIDFKCLNVKCDIGETSVQGNDAVLKARVPQCVNGFFIAEAEGYAPQRFQVSTNTQTSADIVLDRYYNLSLVVRVDGRETGDFVLLYFTGDEQRVVAYPEQKEALLSEGFSNITVYVYKNSSITLGAYSDTKCVKVPKKGVLGILGGEDEECFQIDVPAQTVSNVLVGGGKAVYYFTESELEQGRVLEINVEGFPIPTRVEEIPDNYGLVEARSMEIEVK